jgi:hypothetical protein
MGRIAGLLVLALFAVVPWGGGQARAAVMPYLDFAALAQRAPLVLQGLVTARTSEWTPDKRRIVTRVRVAVEACWRGECGAEAEVLTLGGEVGDLAQWVPGEAAAHEGDRVLLFLEGLPQAGLWRSVGLRQGWFRLDAQARAVRDFRGAGVIAPGTSTPLEPPEELLDLSSLPALLERVPFDPFVDLGPR